MCAGSGAANVRPPVAPVIAFSSLTSMSGPMPMPMTGTGRRRSLRLCSRPSNWSRVMPCESSLRPSVSTTTRFSRPGSHSCLPSW